MSDNSLIEALQSPIDATSQLYCKFMQVRNTLTVEEREALDKAVEGIRQDAGLGKAKKYSASWLAKVLRSFGKDVSVSTVQRHVNKECSCERVSQ